jgi:hypothetical protein
MREEEKPETLEAKVKRQHAELAKAVERAIKPKTLNEILEEYDREREELEEEGGAIYL